MDIRSTVLDIDIMLSQMWAQMKLTAAATQRVQAFKKVSNLARELEAQCGMLTAAKRNIAFQNVLKEVKGVFGRNGNTQPKGATGGLRGEMVAFYSRFHQIMMFFVGIFIRWKDR